MFKDLHITGSYIEMAVLLPLITYSISIPMVLSSYRPMMPATLSSVIHLKEPGYGELPDNFKYWMDQVKDQVSYARANDLKKRKRDLPFMANSMLLPMDLI